MAQLRRRLSLLRDTVSLKRSAAITLSVATCVHPVSSAPLGTRRRPAAVRARYRIGESERSSVVERPQACMSEKCCSQDSALSASISLQGARDLGRMKLSSIRQEPSAPESHLVKNDTKASHFITNMKSPEIRGHVA